MDELPVETSPIVIPEPKPSKLPFILAGIITVASLAAAGFFGYQYLQLKKTLEVTPTPTPSPSLTTQYTVSSNWETYTNHQSPLVFRFPPEYGLMDNDPMTNETGYWQIQLTSPLTYHSPKDTLLNDKELKIEVFISPQQPNDSLDKFFNSQSSPEGNPSGEYELVTVGGKQAYKYKWEGMGTGISYLVLAGGKRISITKLPQTTARDAEFDQILSTFKFVDLSQTKPGWNTFIHNSGEFSIDYPQGWRIAESPNYIGFSPQEIGEDTLIGVNVVSKSDKTHDQIKNEIGNQFPDRVQNEEPIVFSGINATQIITTTNTHPDWYAVLIVIERGNNYYLISNGAQTDRERQGMIIKRTSKNINITFKDFYTSFKFINN